MKPIIITDKIIAQGNKELLAKYSLVLLRFVDALRLELLGHKNGRQNNPFLGGIARIDSFKYGFNIRYTFQGHNGLFPYVRKPHPIEQGLRRVGILGKQPLHPEYQSIFKNCSADCIKGQALYNIQIRDYSSKTIFPDFHNRPIYQCVSKILCETLLDELSTICNSITNTHYQTTSNKYRKFLTELSLGIIEGTERSRSTKPLKKHLTIRPQRKLLKYDILLNFKLNSRQYLVLPEIMKNGFNYEGRDISESNLLTALSRHYKDGFFRYINNQGRKAILKKDIPLYLRDKTGPR